MNRVPRAHYTKKFREEEVGRQQKPQTELEAELQRTKRELADTNRKLCLRERRI